MTITLHHAEQLSDNIVAFYFQPERRLRYTPGQFVELYLPHAPMDQRGSQRIFTLTSTPEEPLLGIAATFPEPGSSFKHALRRLRPGAQLRIVGEPMGDFVLPKDPSIPLIWLAGGVASASFVSMAKELRRETIRRQITLFQSARTAQDLVFGDIWAQAELNTHQTVTRPDSSWHGRRGRFAASDLLTVVSGSQADTMFFISGSDSMVESCCQALAAQGIAREQLVREAFTGY